MLDAQPERPIEERISEELDLMQQHLEESKAKLEQVRQECVEGVTQSWATKKFDMVPGDILLDKVCQRHGVRFKKERDSVQLAALMRAAEISDEIHDLIRDIGHSPPD